MPAAPARPSLPHDENILRSPQNAPPLPTQTAPPRDWQIPAPHSAQTPASEYASPPPPASPDQTHIRPRRSPRPERIHSTSRPRPTSPAANRMPSSPASSG